MRVLILVRSPWEVWVGSLPQACLVDFPVRWIFPTQARSTGSGDRSFYGSLGLWGGEEGINGSPVLLAPLVLYPPSLVSLNPTHTYAVSFFTEYLLPHQLV